MHEVDCQADVRRRKQPNLNERLDLQFLRLMLFA
jgi:hypothetical protein